MTPWTAAHWASLSITNSRSVLKLSPSRGDAIQSSHPLLSSSHPAFNLFQNQGLFQWVSSSGGQSTGASVSASVLAMNIQDWFPLENWLVGSPCSPRDSQETSPTPQFKSINSLGLSFLYGPSLTSIHDYWKNYSFE